MNCEKAIKGENINYVPKDFQKQIKNGQARNSCEENLS